MKQTIIKRLFESFGELERAISAARVTLESKQQPPKELLDHIEMYEEILDKQRTLATALCGHAALGEWDEVARHVRLINGLSAMIRDDARDILRGVTPALEPQEREMMLS
ncbi:MAG: hypothetical protein KDD44_05920 [Bdellovibrionales bacterium]|nr:hypothetical protein [Bdellovibrionales bacterium]